VTIRSPSCGVAAQQYRLLLQPNASKSILGLYCSGKQGNGFFLTVFLRWLQRARACNDNIVDKRNERTPKNPSAAAQKGTIMASSIPWSDLAARLLICAGAAPTIRNRNDNTGVTTVADIQNARAMKLAAKSTLIGSFFAFANPFSFEGMVTRGGKVEARRCASHGCFR
jgi:hypothetical protein